MNKEVVNRILDLQESLRMDEEYRALLAEHEVINVRFLAAAETFSEDQKKAIFDYLGLLIELHTKMLAKACE